MTHAFPVSADAHLEAALNQAGFVTLPELLDAADCCALQALWDEESNFRKAVDMSRYRYGSGEYRYFSNPLPDLVQRLRASFYARLAPLANDWAERLGEQPDFPATLAEFQSRCAAAGQHKPTPLMLRYAAGDYNRLHQDLYGGIAFPFQLVVLLSRPGRDFQGGELVLVEQQARLQSRPHVISLQQGDAAIFPVRSRPVAGVRKEVKAQMRHGVSTIYGGERTTLGVIFHDAD